ncbi:MAG TPA: PucR family transcriptional regulator [Pseudonocardia sp.]
MAEPWVPEAALAVRDLLADPALRLRVLAGTAGLGSEISWAHASELVDPTEFLRGGELMLITGVNLPAGEPARREYVRRLAGAGVAAIAFGTGMVTDRVPAELVDAAEEVGLPLLEVPRAVPFLAITRAVATAINRREQATKDRVSHAQRVLTAAALGRGAPGRGRAPVAAVLDELSRLTGGWAVLVGLGGRVLAAAPTTAADRAPALARDLERLRATPGPASLAARRGTAEVWIQSVHGGDEPLGFLVVGREPALGAVERETVNAAVPLCTLLLARSGAAGPVGPAGRRLRAATLRLLLAGQADVAAEVAGELWDGLPAGPLRVVRGRGGRAVVVEARERLAVDPGVADARALHGELAGELLGVCAAADAEVLIAVLAGVDRLAVGVSEPAGWTELGRAADEAGRAADEAARTLAGLSGAAGGGPAGGRSAGGRSAGGRSAGGGTAGDRSAGGRTAGGPVVVRFGELAAPELLELLPPERAGEFSESLLRPLAADPASAELARSLRAWLAHHGQWDPAAAELGVHRHTLRNRVRKVERLLGADLGSPDLRAELWLALRWTELDAADLGPAARPGHGARPGQDPS